MALRVLFCNLLFEQEWAQKLSTIDFVGENWVRLVKTKHSERHKQRLYSAIYDF
jgi:hypothetical protein